MRPVRVKFPSQTMGLGSYTEFNYDQREKWAAKTNASPTLISPNLFKGDVRGGVSPWMRQIQAQRAPYP